MNSTQAAAVFKESDAHTCWCPPRGCVGPCCPAECRGALANALTAPARRGPPAPGAQLRIWEKPVWNVAFRMHLLASLPLLCIKAGEQRHKRRRRCGGRGGGRNQAGPLCPPFSPSFPAAGLDACVLQLTSPQRCGVGSFLGGLLLPLAACMDAAVTEFPACKKYLQSFVPVPPSSHSPFTRVCGLPVRVPGSLPPSTLASVSGSSGPAAERPAGPAAGVSAAACGARTHPRCPA